MGDGVIQLAIMVMVALSVGGVALAILYPWFSGETAVAKRVVEVTGKPAASSGIRARLFEESKDSRRKQIQDSLKQFEERERQRKKRLTLKALIMQSGLDLSVQAFWLISIGVGIALALAVMLLGVPWFVALGAGVVGAFGLPRWFLGIARKRRQNVFLNDFADAIDVIVRGLKAGLPVNDALKVIAAEFKAPVGPEFLEIVEGQRVGITIDQGIERMFERMPLAEVNFLAIVIAIQQKTGGNLAEALNNLSKVLRDRKKMKAKIKAVSQEAKASAMIIGSLPFIIMGALTVLNPTYIAPLLDTKVGNIMLAGSAIWMLTGCLIMRKMINFDF